MRREVLRAEFDRRLRRTQTDKIWEYLDDKGYVGEILDGVEDIDPDLS